jgi:HAE1 family hydrophobic/amphiphilic exporter-1
MNLIRAAIERPVATISAVLMIVMFGALALTTIPIQLIPEVNKPQVTVNTTWPGAAPAEIEREIVNRQEEVLKGVDGLEKMESQSSTGSGRVTLTFAVGTNMDKSLLLVSNRLDRVNGYPEEADEPTLKTAGADDNPIAWFSIQHMEGNVTPIHTYRDFIEDTVQDRFERVSGVALTNLYGGGARELQIIVDPARLAQYRLTIGEVASRLRAEHASFSAGELDEGKRSYVVRSEGELDSPESIEAVVLRSELDPVTGRVSRVSVADIGEVRYDYGKPRATIRRNGAPGLAVNAVRETGANVIEVMKELRAAVVELNEDVLHPHGLHLHQVYDETIYIESAIDLVQTNIVVGGILAAIVLLLFLRSWRPTLIIAIAIPVSVIGSFVAMAMLGRSLNVISLAGIAFAVGMVVDAAIVVLENIYRLREKGYSPTRAAYEGAKQVWGAILVSALTTVLVFVPILTTDLEVGQLFRDIAVAISVSVVLSLLVAITVIPALSKRLFSGELSKSKRLSIPPLDAFGRMFLGMFVGLARRTVANRAFALLWVGAITAVAIVGTVLFLPRLDYLPEGNRNLLFGFLLPPAGYNLETNTGIAKTFEDATRHRWVSETGPEPGPDGLPKMEDFYFVAFGERVIVLARSAEPERLKELQAPLFREVAKHPDIIGFFRPASVFGRGIGGARSIEVDVVGIELEDAVATANGVFRRVSQVFPRAEGHQARPLPSLELGAPEVRVYPDRVRLADNGVTARELGLTIDASNDGLRILQTTVGSERLDLKLKGREGSVTSTQDIGALPVVARNGVIVPVSSLADVQVTTGPVQIRHKERNRTITIALTPADAMPLEEAIAKVENEVLAPLEAEGLPPGVVFRVSGTADELGKAKQALSYDLLVALVIVFLVMAIQFESFIYPLVILFSVPLATAGAVMALAAINIFAGMGFGAIQNLDMLTVLGFVILIGVVVNNAILLVDQTLQHIRDDGMQPGDAIAEATSNRIRPIFMSTLTSVIGMAPLVLFPGAGSELYRGLGAVVIGGLAMSSVMTLAIVPPLMGIVLAPIEGRRMKRAAADNDDDPASDVRVAAE